jgi:amino-acid N-acetyltransferase
MGNEEKMILEDNDDEKMKIRKAIKTDVALIKKMLRDNDLPFEDISLQKVSLLIGYSNSKILGVSGVEIYGNYGLLRSLVIREPFRESGLGKELVFKLIEYVKLKGVKELYLLTTTAEGFFKKLGFKKIERSNVPEIVQTTREFKDLCPVSASCMKKEIVS